MSELMRILRAVHEPGPDETENENFSRRVVKTESGVDARTQEEIESDMRDAYEERAAILEYDGELPRHTAEARARREIYGTVSGSDFMSGNTGNSGNSVDI